MAGHGNNRLLWNATFLSKHVIPGYKLYDSGFPVAAEDPESSVIGELWEIAEDDGQTLHDLDRLEGEGRMYKRVEVEPDVSMYVGISPFWRGFEGMNECPQMEKMYSWRGWK